MKKKTIKKSVSNKQLSIREHLENFMNEDNSLCYVGSFSTNDFKLLSKALDSTLGNFIVFDNAGGKPFEIIHRDDAKTMKKLSNALKKRFYSCIFMEKINGKETVMRKLPSSY